MTARATVIPNPATVLPPLFPTSTRVPDIGLGRLITTKLDAVIDGLPAVPESDIAAYVAQHASVGPLTWTENGPRIDGRPMGVGQADELTIEYLSPSSPTNSAVPLLSAVYEDDITTLPDDHIRFQGQRMEELLYWMVYRSTERQGALIITYDDFGSRQTIGIVDFSPFSLPLP